MLVLVHRLLNEKIPNSNWYKETWTVEKTGDLVADYLELEKSLAKELDETNSINHYCMFELGKQIICYSQLDSNDDVRELIDTVTSIAYILKSNMELTKDSIPYLQKSLDDLKWLHQYLIDVQDSN